MNGSTDSKFFAHSVPDADESFWQPLSEHLDDVGELAAKFGAAFGAAEAARALGLLHDLGKYTPEFQQRLRGGKLHVDHSTWGAKIACERLGSIGRLLAYGIAGHHAGLANGAGEGERTSLSARLQLDLPTLDAIWQQEIELPQALSMPAGFKLRGETVQEKKDWRGFQLAFFTRMLFSCLVDADFLDTEQFYKKVGGEVNYRTEADPAPPLQALRAQLDRHLSGFRADSDVNKIRANVLQQVRSRAADAPGLFSLTVPTGGGKTLTSLAFALDHALAHGLRRIIFVIPYTSIVEQNARVFRDALGDLGSRAVLEHHSAFVARPVPKNDHERYQAQEKLRLAMENWDAPIVVTTAVQFFKSLFAARPSRCRKLHNVAGSVVVLDEAQTMPLKLLRPCVAAIDELARNYRSSVVLCTATQPALEAPNFVGGLDNVRELVPEPKRLFARLRRVSVRQLGVLNDAELSEHLRSRGQVLCIVNNRRHARAVYQGMTDLPGARHLTTLMCARHRSKVLDEVRQLLDRGESCRLVSTSLIEAGVDVDFPTVLRAEAGLDSIAQAAGRCNREGKRDAATSEVLIFATDNKDWAPPVELLQYAGTGREILRQFASDPLLPDVISRYFELLYWQQGEDAMDEPALLSLLKSSRVDSLPMETLEKKFRMIDNVQVPIIVPYDGEARGLLQSLEHAEYSGGLARKLQPYLVQLPKYAFEMLYKAGAVTPVQHRKVPDKWQGQFMMLANESLYDKDFGLNWDDPTFIRADSLNW